MRSTDVLRNQAIELASRAFGNLGTRFKVFPQAGVPRDPFEKIDVLGGDGIRVSGVNPDGVVRGSGIFAGGMGRATNSRVRGARGGTRCVLRPAHAAPTR
jgi:hypothetical protein